MTISELIAKLQELQAEHGDLPVWADSYDDSYEVGALEFREEERSLYGTIKPALINLYEGNKQS